MWAWLPPLQLSSQLVQPYIMPLCTISHMIACSCPADLDTAASNLFIVLAGHSGRGHFTDVHVLDCSLKSLMSWAVIGIAHIAMSLCYQCVTVLNESSAKVLPIGVASRRSRSCRWTQSVDLLDRAGHVLLWCSHQAVVSRISTHKVRSLQPRRQV